MGALDPVRLRHFQERYANFDTSDSIPFLYGIYTVVCDIRVWSVFYNNNACLYIVFMFAVVCVYTKRIYNILCILMGNTLFVYFYICVYLPVYDIIFNVYILYVYRLYIHSFIYARIC